ncbi:hybrid sensor histidine kinase/response regulator [Emticicia sp. 17c]|uniref:hybrid sensor histidine kinase/response regulator n=1 Tax=Emticicia sp. 17c TaxID=3127704 RepID=UPI00301C25C2
MKELDTIRVLIVDDDEDDFFLTSDYLNDIKGKKFTLDWAKNFDDAVGKITSCNYDICFFDFLLGAKTGLDLLKRAIQEGCQSPIILLTGKGDQKIDMEAMRLGAVDYLVKSELDPEKLERCIRYSLERADTLKTLRESEQQYRTIFNHVRQGIIVTQPKDGSFIYYNPATLEMLGYEAEELNNMSTAKIFEKPEVWHLFNEKLEENGSIDKFEAIFLTKNGERKICLIDAQKQKNSEGKESFLSIIHDVTAQRKAEREAMMLEKMAATGRLVRTLAHEVRNPLTNIHLSVEQMESELQDEDSKLFLGIIRRNSQRISDLITELLNNSKPSELAFAKISAHEILEETLEQAIDRINLKSISLEKQYGEDCLLNLDRSKIKIALLNIIINAVEAMEENKGVLIIKTYIANNQYYVCIKDNGTGISPENMSRLFEPYFTAKNNGIGLGLSATLNIIQSHKATVDVNSEVGKGTEFIITFGIY